MLVINVTWRGKTYVGTLMDATKYDWAPPRPSTESPTSDIEGGGARGGRGKRRGAIMLDSSMHERRLRNGKRSQQQVFNAPPSPAKSDTSTASTSKRRKTPVEEAFLGGEAKRSRLASDSDKILKDESELYECDVGECKKKYKSVSALRYHQSHNHVATVSKDTPEKKTSKKKNKSKSKKAKKMAAIVVKDESKSEDSDTDRLTPSESVETPSTPTPPVNITYQLSAQASNGTTIVGQQPPTTTTAATTTRVTCAQTVSVPVASSAAVSVPVASATTVSVLRVTESSPNVDKKKGKNVEKKHKHPPDVRPLKSLTTLPTSGVNVPGFVSPASSVISGSTALKPIQPKPTVMGEPVTSNPIMGKTKEKKSKKKKNKDKERKEKTDPSPPVVTPPETTTKDLDTPSNPEENNNRQERNTDSFTVPNEQKKEVVKEVKTEVQTEQKPSPDVIMISDTKEPPKSQVQIPANGVRHGAFIHVGKYTYAAEAEHHMQLMKNDLNYRTQYENMVKDFRQKEQQQQQQQTAAFAADIPRSSVLGVSAAKEADKNNVKQGIPHLKPPQLISSYQSHDSGATVVVNHKEEEVVKTSGEKLIYERQKEDLQRRFLLQQKLLLEQQQRLAEGSKSEMTPIGGTKPLNLSSTPPKSDEKRQSPAGSETIKTEIKTEMKPGLNIQPMRDVKPNMKLSPKPGETPAVAPLNFGYYYPGFPMPQGPYSFDPYRAGAPPGMLNYGNSHYPALTSDSSVVRPDGSREDKVSPHAATERLQKHVFQYHKANGVSTPLTTPPSNGTVPHKIHELATKSASPSVDHPKKSESPDKKVSPPSSEASSTPLHHLHTHHHTHVVRPGYTLSYEPYPGKPFYLFKSVF